MRKTRGKRSAFLAGLLTFLLCFGNAAYAVVLDDVSDKYTGTAILNAMSNDTPSPKLSVKDISIIEVDGDGDGGIDPGETIDMSIILINSGLEVEELAGLLTTENRDVTILEDEAYFTRIPSGGEGISTPLRFRVSHDVQANRDRRLEFIFNITSITTPAEEIRPSTGNVVTADGEDKERYNFEILVMVDYPEVDSAPLRIPRVYSANMNESVLVEDLDNDGEKELINFVRLNSEDDPVSLVVSSADDISVPPQVIPIPGTEFSGPWPARYVVAGDVNGDGRKELFFNVYLSNENEGIDNRYIFALNSDGDILNSYWPLDYLDSKGESPYPGPILTDVTGDRKKEIVFATNDTPGIIGPDTRCRLYVVDDEGRPLQGRGWSWPVLVSGSDPLIIQGLAAGDINNDGVDEIVASVQSGGAFNIGGYVYAWDGKGDVCEGWPRELPRDTHTLGIVLGDIDVNYPGLEVAAISRVTMVTPGTVERDIRSSLHVWHYDGTPAWEEPRYTISPYDQWKSRTSPIVCDLDQDGELEIIAMTSNNIYAFRSDGSSYRGTDGIFVSFSDDTIIGNEPIVANIDDDPQPEVLVTICNKITGDRRLIAYNFDGSLNETFPISFGNRCFLSLPLVNDLNSDGKAEICINELRPGTLESIDKSYLKTHILNSSAVPSILEWPMYRHDPRHTGCYTKPTIVGIIPSSASVWETVTITGQNFGTDIQDEWYNPNCDFDNDGDVDYVDYHYAVELFKKSWLSRQGDLSYDPAADIVHDDKIDSFDIQAFLGSTGTERNSNWVKFEGSSGFAGGVEAKIISWSDTTITCEVPHGARTGEVVVINEHGRSSNPFGFTVVGRAGEDDLDYNVALEIAWNKLREVINPDPSFIASHGVYSGVDESGNLWFEFYKELSNGLQKPLGTCRITVDLEEGTAAFPPYVEHAALLVRQGIAWVVGVELNEVYVSYILGHNDTLSPVDTYTVEVSTSRFIANFTYERGRLKINNFISKESGIDLLKRATDSLIDVVNPEYFHVATAGITTDTGHVWFHFQLDPTNPWYALSVTVDPLTGEATYPEGMEDAILRARSDAAGKVGEDMSEAHMYSISINITDFPSVITGFSFELTTSRFIFHHEYYFDTDELPLTTVYLKRFDVELYGIARGTISQSFPLNLEPVLEGLGYHEDSGQVWFIFALNNGDRVYLEVDPVTGEVTDPIVLNTIPPDFLIRIQVPVSPKVPAITGL